MSVLFTDTLKYKLVEFQCFSCEIPENRQACPSRIVEQV